MTVHAGDPWIWNPFYFRGKVKTGGDWDLKNTPEYDSSRFTNGFIYDGKAIGSDAPGNIHYGYVGSGPWWSSANLLLEKAGGVQTNSQPQWQNSYFHGDDPVDQVNILWGMNQYLNNH